MSVRGVVAGIGVLLVAAVCVRLGFWQLHRLEERRGRNAALSAALREPVLTLEGEGLAAVAADPERFRFRRVRAEGRYDPTQTFLLRGRARQGSPGVHLVTPLRLGGGDTVLLVDRGWLSAADAATADPRPYRVTAPVAVQGLLHPLPETRRDEEPLLRSIEGFEVRTFRSLHTGMIGEEGPTVVLPVYLQRLPAPGEADAAPYADPIPALDEGPHLGYAFQWFSFAAIAVIGFALLAFRRTRQE